MKPEPVWEVDERMTPWEGEDSVTYYLTRTWPDGGREQALLVEKSYPSGQKRNWARVGGEEEYVRLVKRERG